MKLPDYDVIDIGAYREALSFFSALRQVHPGVEFQGTYGRFAELWRALSAVERSDRQRLIAAEARDYVWGLGGPAPTRPARERALVIQFQPHRR